MFDGLEEKENKGKDSTACKSFERYRFQQAKQIRKLHQIDRKTPFRVQIMGLYDTGTNLLEALLVKNFPVLEVYGNEVPVGEYAGNPRLGGAVFWKHDHLTELRSHHPEMLPKLKANSIYGIAVMRSPLSWLQAFQKAPYDEAECVYREGWLTESCNIPLNVGLQSGETQRYTIPNVEWMWNEWMREFKKTLPAYGFADYIVVKYEDLVLNYQGILTQVQMKLNLVGKSTYENVMDPSKQTGQPVGHEAAKLKITSKSYLMNFTNQELSDICSRLDPEMLAWTGYTDCDDILSEAHAKAHAETPSGP